MGEIIDYIFTTKWKYFAYTVPSILIIVLFYLKNKKIIFDNLKGFIRWVKPSLESMGMASPEKLTAFTVLCLTYVPSRWVFVIGVFTEVIKIDAIHLLYGSAMDLLFILVLFRIISPQQIIELRTGIKVEPEKPQE